MALPRAKGDVVIYSVMLDEVYLRAGFHMCETLTKLTWSHDTILTSHPSTHYISLQEVVKAKVLSSQAKRAEKWKDWLNIHVCGDKEPISIDWNTI